MYNWSGRSNKEKEVLFIQRLLGRDTSTSSLAQYGEFIPVVGNDSEPDSKLLYYKDIIESLEISATLVDRPDVSDTEVVNFTLDDSGYKIVSLVEEYGRSTDNTTYSGVEEWLDHADEITLNTSYRYLWNKSTITLSNGTSDSSYKMIASYIGTNSNGIIIDGLTEWYAVSPYNTYAPENIQGSGIEQWSNDKPIGIVIDNRYIWNYNIITFNDSTTQGGYHNAMIIGDYGNQLREVKFVANTTGPDYRINNGKIIANEDWWNKRGGLGKVTDWYNIADITQIQINDVVIIRGIATIGTVGSQNTYQCTTLVNAKVNQIVSDNTSLGPYRIRATTLNYIIEDAIALADDLYIQASQNIYYVNDVGEILNPQNKYIEVFLKTSSRVTSISVSGWSIYNGLGGYDPPTTFIESYYNNGTLYEDPNFQDPVDPIEGTILCEKGYYYIVDTSDPLEDEDPWTRYDFYIYDTNNILQKLDSGPTSILIFLEDYSTLNPIEVRCNKVVYNIEGDESSIERLGLSVTLLREISSTKLELRCDNIEYEINPRKSTPGVTQARIVDLVNIGVALESTHTLIPSSNSVSIDDHISDPDQVGYFNLTIPYNEDTNQITVTYVNPDLPSIGNIEQFEESEVTSDNVYATFQRAINPSTFDGFYKYVSYDPLHPEDLTKEPIEVGDNLVLFRRISYYEGEYYAGVINSISTSNDIYTVVIGPFIGGSSYVLGVYHYADILFNGIYISPEPRYLGSSSNVDSLLLDIGSPIIGDSYFDTSEHTVKYYSSINNWISYDQVPSDSIRLKLLRDSLYDALRNGSSLLSNSENVDYFVGLASEDAFINHLMTNYLKLGKILYSGKKEALEEENITGYYEDPNNYHITKLYSSDTSKYPTGEITSSNADPELVYKLPGNQSPDRYFRYYEELRDSSDFSTYKGFIEIDKEDRTNLTNYDFDPESNTKRSKVKLSSGFFATVNGDFELSNSFKLYGEIKSDSLETINTPNVSGTYTSIDSGMIAIYNYNDIGSYLGIPSNPSIINSYRGSQFTGTIDGNTIVDADYVTSRGNTHPLCNSTYSASSCKYSWTVSCTASYDGTVSWNYNLPYTELFWQDRRTLLTIKVGGTTVSSSYTSHSGSYSVSRGQVISVTNSGIGDPVSNIFSKNYSGSIYIYYTTVDFKSGYNFYTNNGTIINVYPTGSSSNYYSDTVGAKNINLTNSSLNRTVKIIKGVTKSQALSNDPNYKWTPPKVSGVDAIYVKGLIPKTVDDPQTPEDDSRPFEGTASDFSNGNSITIIDSSNVTHSWTHNNISYIVGRAEYLDIHGMNDSLTFSPNSYYRGFNITLIPELEPISVKVKDLLPMEAYDSQSGAGYSIGTTNSMFKEVWAGQVHNAVWNDYVDMLTVNSDLVLTPGKCYVKIGDNFDVSTKYCQSGTIGIHSDTFAHSVGNVKDVPQLAISVSGYVLAYTDKRYAPGTPLTSGKGGTLTKMRWWSRMFHPERLVGTYLRDENGKYWNESVLVNGRNWIKVK